MEPTSEPTCSNRPAWPDLPHDTRMTVVALLAQLLDGERRHPLPTPRAEVEHE